MFKVCIGLHKYAPIFPIFPFVKIFQYPSEAHIGVFSVFMRL